jgi:hypothetical protein
MAWEVYLRFLSVFTWRNDSIMTSTVISLSVTTVKHFYMCRYIFVYLVALSLSQTMVECGKVME